MRTFSTIGGNGGTFKAWHDTGEAFEHAPSEEVASGDHEGYADVARVDWAEHLAFWNAGRAADHQYTVPHDYIDILDVSGTLASGEAFKAESDWRIDRKAEFRCNYPHLFEKTKYTLRLWERADKANPLHVETFEGDLNGAGRRLDEIWNACPAAVMNGARYRAAAIEAGSRRHAIQIW